MQLLTRWWREWAKVDLLALGIGVLINVAYVIYTVQHPDDKSPILNLWPNCAVGFIDLWLSVRIIDNLIQRRETHHDVRRAIVTRLQLFNTEMQDLNSYFGAKQVSYLKNELVWLEGRLLKHRRHISNDEYDDVCAALKCGHRAIEHSEWISCLFQQVKELDTKIERTTDNINEQRGAKQFSLLFLKWFKDLEDDYLQYKTKDEPDLDILKAASCEFSNSKDNLPPAIVPLVQDYIDKIQSTAKLKIVINREFKELEQLILKVRANIYQETAPNF